MRNYKDDFNYTTNWRPKKVKHVHFVMNTSLVELERNINAFADDNPNLKILGIRLMNGDGAYVATITYLCDAPSEFDSYDDYTDEEED